MKLVYIINDGQVEKPINSEAVDIELNFDNSDPDSAGTISLLNFDFTIDAAKIINEHFEGGMSGGPGVFEGLPFRLNLEEGSEVLELIRGYIDLTNSEVVFKCDRIEAFVKEAGSKTWLEDGAEDSFNYQYLEVEKRTITSSDYIFLPYVISSVPNNKEIAILLLMGFSVTLALRDAIQNVIQTAVEFAGVASGIRAVIKFILIVAYLIVLIITIVNLIRDIVNQIIQPVKYHACMRLQTLLEKGAEQLGQKFESSVFLDPVWRDMVVLPAKYSVPLSEKDENIFGFTKPDATIQKGYYNGTFGQLMRSFETLINGKKFVGDGVIRIERRDYNPLTVNFKIPDVEIKGFGINANELKSNILLKFTTDLQDTNTIDNYTGNVCQVITSPVSVDNPDMVLMSGLNSINSEFSRGLIKDDFTGPERFVLGILKPIDKLIGGLSKAASKVGINITKTDLSAIIGKRLGMLKLGNDFTSTPKLITLDISPNAEGTKLKEVNQERVNMGDIYDRYYKIDSFTPTKDNENANQYKKYEAPPFNMCFDDFKSIIKSNVIFDQVGRIGQMTGLVLNVESEQARDVKFRINEAYTTNLKDNKIVSDGIG
jgi:hypothetical protein